jgi:tight adherence protein B
MRVVITLLVGTALARACVRSARRYAVADRLRGERTRAPLRLPAAVRSRIAVALDAAALDMEVERAVSTWAWCVSTAFVLGIGVGGPQLALALVAVVALALPTIVLLMHERRARRIAVAVPETLERVASELRAGGTVVTAVAALGAGDTPLAADMARVDTRLRLGASVSEALAGWSSERRAAGVDASAGALAMCSSVGGRAADALEGLASSLRDRLAVMAEARAQSAQARMSAFVVGGAPIAYIAWSAMIDPHSLRVLTATAFGRTCLVGGLTLELVGAWWMRAVVRSGSWE